MSFPALKEAQGRLDLKRKELHEIFAEAGDEYDMSKVTKLDGDSHAKVKGIRDLNDEIDALAKEVEGYLAIKGIADRNRDGDDPGARQRGDDSDDGGLGGGAKSFGELFTGSKAYKGRTGQNGPEAHLDLELKALFSTTTGWLPETTRTGRLVEAATRPIQVIDLIPGTTTKQTSVVYMEETLFQNNAAEVNEGGVYPESAFQLTEQNSPVKKIGTWVPVTDEQLEDEGQAQGYLNNRLPFALRQRMDGQILVGNGAGPNLKGFLNYSGIQTQAKGSDPVPDAIYKGMVNVRVTGRAMPSAVIFHPLDWQDVRLLRTSDGIYIWGNPSEAGPDRIWGLPVAQADSITQNTALVGDYANFTELSTRRGVDVQVSNSHAGFFIEGKQAVRADVRVALIVYRQAALCQVTGV